MKNTILGILGQFHSNGFFLGMGSPIIIVEFKRGTIFIWLAYQIVIF